MSAAPAAVTDTARQVTPGLFANDPAMAAVLASWRTLTTARTETTTETK